MEDEIEKHASLSQKKNSKRHEKLKKSKKQRLAKIMHMAEEISYNENIDMDEAQ